MRLIRLLRVLAALLVLTTFVLLVQLTLTAFKDVHRSTRALAAVEQFRLSLTVAEMVSRERGPTNGLLGEGLPHTETSVQRLAEARARTNLAFVALKSTTSPLNMASDARLQQAHDTLSAARAGVDQLASQELHLRSSAEISSRVSQMVSVPVLLAPLINDVSSLAEASFPAVGSDLQAARLVAELREYAGLLGSHLTAALAAGRPLTSAELFALQRTWGRVDELRFLVTVRLNRAQEPANVVKAWETAQQRYFGTSLQLVEQMIARSEAGVPYGLDPAGFAQAYVPDMNALFDVRDLLLDLSLEHTRQARRDDLRVLVLVVVGVVFMTLLLIGLIAVVQRRILKPLVAVADAVHELADNKPMTELPQPVAQDEMAAVIGAVRALQERTQQRLLLEQERDSLIEQLRSRSNTDALTGLLNRRGFFESGEQLLEQARRHGFPVTGILFDLDHFKRLNDEQGHAAGDQALSEVAGVIRAQLRSSDLAGRIGGEEFALLLSHCDVAQGQQFAERLRAALERLAPRPAVLPGKSALPITASFGVAGFSESSTSLQSLLSHADAAMYSAKTSGRNRVTAAA